MTLQGALLSIAGTLLGISIATAGDMGVPLHTGFQPLIGLQGGYASSDTGKHTARFLDTDNDVFTYHSRSNNDLGFVGVFVGAEHRLNVLSPLFLMQAGIEYNYFDDRDVKGIHTVGIEPQTSTVYSYRYNIQTQQALGLFKLLTPLHERFHPYTEVGLGAAFNNARQYRAITHEIGSINIAPGFSNHSTTQFSYILGLGIDTAVYANIRIGIGYRYSNFGSTSLGHGSVAFQNYRSPVPFTLNNRNTDANQFIARLSVLI